MIVSKTLIKQNRDLFKNTRFIIVQHLLPDTLDFCNSLLDNGIEISTVFSKPYSHRAASENELRKRSVDIRLLKQDEKLDYERCKNVLDAAEEKSKADGKQILIMDLGGQYSKIIADEKFEHLAGVVEDTAFGHRRYKDNPSNNHVVFSVAEGEMKEMEANYVGASIVDSAELLLNRNNSTLYDKQIFLVGYGMIGKNVAKRLKINTESFVVYDNDKAKLLAAESDGFKTAALQDISDADVVIGVTGNASVSANSLQYKLKDGAMLISGSSNKVEFDVGGYDTQKDFGNIKKLSKDGRTILLFNDGQPVNFLTNSVPDEIIDLVFAEMFQATKAMLLEKELETGNVLKVADNYIHEIKTMFCNELINPNYSGLAKRLTDKELPKDLCLKGPSL
ncbi:MAG: hypothetical protein FWE53_04255 [Firmicutes bacterium]|nr:hypothetical protein [Bacillota bacterium]